LFGPVSVIQNLLPGRRQGRLVTPGLKDRDDQPDEHEHPGHDSGVGQGAFLAPVQEKGMTGTILSLIFGRIGKVSEFDSSRIVTSFDRQSLDSRSGIATTPRDFGISSENEGL
jgi:hypothetical protein